MYSFKYKKNFLSCLFYKIKNKDFKKLVEIISIINLEKKKNLIAKNLSHGEKQWLEIGMLLIQQSDLLLIDEPVAGMTETETKKTSELLINISKERTVLVVEHDMNFIESLDVDVIVLNEGSVLTRGSMKKIKKNKQVIDIYLGR